MPGAHHELSRCYMLTSPPSRAPTRPRLLGQTYDCDDKEVNGQHDDYSHLDNGQPVASRTSKGGTVTTRAKAEAPSRAFLPTTVWHRILPQRFASAASMPLPHRFAM